MICYQYAPAADGGAERQAQRLAEALAARGYIVGVVTPHLPGLPRHERIGGVEVHRIWAVAKPGRLSLTFLPALAGFLMFHGQRYDVWHVHQAFFHAWIALLGAQLFGRHCLIKAAASGPYGDIARLRHRWLGRCVLDALPQADAVISLNAELTHELLAIGVPRSRLRVIYSGVDTQAFAPPTAAERDDARATLGLPSGAAIVVFAGRLTREKGVDVLFDSWRLIEAEQQHREAMLVLAGQGTRAAEYTQRAKLDFTRMRVLGRVPDIRPLFRAADLLVLPSMSEGLSNVVLEAMAMGLPVVTSRIGGLEEQVQDRGTGLLVRPGDARALADAIGSLIRAPQWRMQMGAAGRAVVENRFALGLMVDAYERLYAELAAQREVAPR